MYTVRPPFYFDEAWKKRYSLVFLLVTRTRRRVLMRHEDSALFWEGGLAAPG